MKFKLSIVSIVLSLCSCFTFSSEVAVPNIIEGMTVISKIEIANEEKDKITISCPEDSNTEKCKVAIVLNRCDSVSEVKCKRKLYSNIIVSSGAVKVVNKPEEEYSVCHYFTESIEESSCLSNQSE